MRSTIGEFLEFVIYISFRAIEKAKKYNSTQYDIHLHLENCTAINLNIKMCKYIYTEVNKIFEDTTRNIYIHSNSEFIFMALRLIKPFLEK